MLDLSVMREKCDRLQWSVDQIDWDGPGKERVDPARAAALVPFMSDLYWIETIAGIVFASMARRTAEPELKSIFQTFAMDEERHAEAELGLMVRWGMLRRGEQPAQNVNARLLLALLQKGADQVHPSVFSAIIPMTELVLDGALVKYLNEAIDDPICRQVFEKINADEARHLAIDFYVLEKFGRENSVISNGADLVTSLAHTRTASALLLGYVPLLARSRKNLVAAGMDLAQVRRCLERYIALGETNAHIGRHPSYVLIRAYAKRLANQKFGVGDTLMRASDWMERASPRAAKKSA